MARPHLKVSVYLFISSYQQNGSTFVNLFICIYEHMYVYRSRYRVVPGSHGAAAAGPLQDIAFIKIEC